MTKTAFVFGAGASFGAMPLVNEMVNHLPILIDILKKLKIHQRNDEGIALSVLINSLENINHDLEHAETPDAVMHSLYLNRSSDFDVHLKSFWIYLILCQFANRNEIGLDRLITTKRLKFYDKRYYELISDLKSRPNNNYIFLSWNYDLQFQLSHRRFARQNSILDSFENFTTYPISVTSDITTEIIHLNGLTGFYDKTDKPSSNIRNEIASLIEPHSTLAHCLKNLLWALYPINRNRISLDNYLKFSFTNSDDQLNKLKKVITKSIQGVNKLIYIGYSFPELNTDIDDTIINNLEPFSGELILQNPVNFKQKVLNSFQVNSENIRIIEGNDATQKFVIE